MTRFDLNQNIQKIIFQLDQILEEKEREKKFKEIERKY